MIPDADDVDTDDQLPTGVTGLSAAVNALAATGVTRRQVRLAVPMTAGTMTAGGGGPEDERLSCRASLSERSLFIFSEENFIRKYAKIIIEWGYPFCCVRL